LTTHAEAFNHLVAIADWSGGQGNAGCWSERMLADRWGWNQTKVRRFLLRLERSRVIRRVLRFSGTAIILLKNKWEFEGETLPRIPSADIGGTERITLAVVATYFDMAESHIRGIMNSRTGRRGRPSRIQRDQDAVSMWIYLMNTSGGFTAHQIMSRTGVHRRAVMRIAAAIEDRRDNDPEFEATITAMEAAYRAAEAVIRRAA